MLRREAELRVSSEVQDKYRKVEAAVGNDETTWMEVTVELQKQVCREFGFGGGCDGRGGRGGNGGFGEAAENVSLGEALSQLRAAAARHQDVCPWQRLVQHKAVRGTLTRGDPIPNVVVYDLEVSVLPSNNGGANGGASGALALRNLTPSDGRPLGVIALSYS